MNIIIQYVQIKLRPMGIHHSPHTHPTPIPMGIPIPTAALENLKTDTNPSPDPIRQGATSRGISVDPLCQTWVGNPTNGGTLDRRYTLAYMALQ